MRYQIGGLGFKKDHDTQLAIGILLVICTLVNTICMGPTCYPIVAETPSGRLRYKTIAIGRFAYNIVSIIQNIITPRMLSSTGKHIGMIILLDRVKADAALSRLELGR